jgi:hypothetical protein
VWRVVSRHTPQKRNRRKTETVKPKNGFLIAGQTILYRSLPYWRAMLNRASGPDGEAEDDGAALMRAKTIRRQRRYCNPDGRAFAARA